MSSRFRIIVAIGLVVSLFTASFSAMAQGTNGENGNDTDDTTFDHDFEIHGFDFRSPEFYNVWERTDRPVLDGDVERSWLWGPAANTEVFEEPYVEADDGMREVQYGDKSRMEMPVPGSDAAAEEDDSPWAITQGLLAIELMTGNLQVGDEAFVPYLPAEIPVAGDGKDNPGPTYADMGEYIDWDARNTGATITQYLDENGDVQDDESLAEYDVFDRYYISQTDHNIASVFWDFMQSEGLVYVDGDLETGPLFLNEFYAIGYPVTEAYWGEFTLRGDTQDILVQCFERRCLTYAPDNEPEWQVESGNVGLHYHEWRYELIGDPITPDLDLSLELDQDHDVNASGTLHEFTATLTESDSPFDIDDADDVSVTVHRNGATDPVDFTDNNLTVSIENNIATIAYTGPEALAVDTINASIMVDGVEVVGEPTLTKTWCEGVVENGESIQTAIDAASDGDTICVLAGTYNENIEIDVDGLTLWAIDGAEETTIVSDIAGTGAGESEGVVGINASDVVLNGFTIDNDENSSENESRAVRVNSSVDGVVIQNNVMVDSFRAIQGDWEGQGGANITIEDNIFNTALGIAGTEAMDNLVISGNTFNTTIEGIGLGNGVDVTITSNHFAGQEDHVRDWRTAPDQSQLEQIIIDNTFENAVEVVNGNAIRDQ